MGFSPWYDWLAAGRRPRLCLVNHPPGIRCDGDLVSCLGRLVVVLGRGVGFLDEGADDSVPHAGEVAPLIKVAGVEMEGEFDAYGIDLDPHLLERGEVGRDCLVEVDVDQTFAGGAAERAGAACEGVLHVHGLGEGIETDGAGGDVDVDLALRVLITRSA